MICKYLSVTLSVISLGITRYGIQKICVWMCIIQPNNTMESLVYFSLFFFREHSTVVYIQSVQSDKDVVIISDYCYEFIINIF